MLLGALVLSILPFTSTGSDTSRRAAIPTVSGDQPAGPAMPASWYAPSPDVVRILIDPGHGGKDPGAVGPTGLQEKDVNLIISTRLADWLRGAWAGSLYDPDQ